MVTVILFSYLVSRFCRKSQGPALLPGLLPLPPRDEHEPLFLNKETTQSFLDRAVGAVCGSLAVQHSWHRITGNVGGSVNSIGTRQ